MQELSLKTYRKESDLLKAYRAAEEQSKYLSDIDDKLLSYNNVIQFCASSKKCSQKESLKRNQILFWTYDRISDLFLQKNLNTFEVNNLLYALECLQNALLFTRSNEEKKEVLQKMRDIYLILSDERGYYKTSEALIELIDDALKIETFLSFADVAKTKTEEAFFLEEALKLITQEKMEELKKCKRTLVLCDRLLDIYEKAGKRADAARILTLKNEAQNLLQ